MSIKIHLVFIVPQSLPKLFKEYYKNYEYKDYGIGKYKPLLDYFKDIKEYKESTDSQDQSLSITHTRVFLSPYKANKLNFAFALGLDDWLDKENITEFKIISGGVYEEGEKQPKILATLASNDDRLVYEALEESKEKEDKYAPISLKFNGKFLTIIIKEKNTIQRISFQAVSGRPQKINGKHYFTYEKERQVFKGEGHIPEGEYYITPLSENKDDGVQELSTIDNIIGSVSWVLSKVKLPKRGEFYGGSFAWGKIRIPIQPKTKTLTDSKRQTITRKNFFIHGGVEAGSAGRIDLWDKNDKFFEKLLNYVEKYKNEILENQGKIPLIVKYEDSTKIECDNATYTKYCKPIGKESK